MKVPVGADVSTTDVRRVGESWCLVVDPVEREVTHVVVREWGPPARSWVVPLEAVASVGPDGIDLARDTHWLRSRRAYRQTDFVEVDDPSLFPYDPAVAWPYVAAASPPPVTMRVPKGEVPFRRADDVLAKDGTRLGRVDELLVDRVSAAITHLVVRERHHGDGEVAIPLSAVASCRHGRVRLALGPAEVARLPAVGIQRPPRPAAQALGAASGVSAAQSGEWMT